LISPEVEIAGDKLCALIDPDCFRETDLPADLFEYLHNIRAAEIEPRFDRGREARERVNSRGQGHHRSAGWTCLPDMLNLYRRPGRTAGTPILFCEKLTT